MQRLLFIAAAITAATACCWDDTCPSGETDSGYTLSTGAPTPTGTPTTTTTTTTTTGDPTTSPPCESLVSQPSFTNTGHLTGHVTSPSGTVAVRSAVAEVVVDQETAWMLTNCNDGGFELELPAGEHLLTVTKGRWTAAQLVTVTAGQTTDLGTVPLDVAAVEIAVVQGDYDDIGALMDDAGIPYQSIGRPRDLFDDPAVLAGYDVVFVNCGTLAGKGDDPYTPTQTSNVRNWVMAGGTLYASDWEHELIEGAIPEAIHFGPDPRQGEIGMLTADVMDREIQSILGKEQADLMFNLNEWAVMDGVDQALPLVMATTPQDSTYRPMAALMPLGAGKAIYTSFHNEWQITDDMEILLYEMILSL